MDRTIISLRMRSCAAAMTALMVASCATPAQRSEDSTRAGVTRPAADRAHLAQLEERAHALAKSSGCDTAGACGVAPLGWRACGGPRDYLVYCRAATDTIELLRVLEELRRAESDFNEKSGTMSTCEMRLPPEIDLRGGRCEARR
jgi:hypothetical protein